MTQETKARTSVLVTATGLVVRGGGEITALNLIGGSATGTAVLNDSTGGAGTDFFALSAVTGSNNPVTLSRPLPFTNGLYVTLSGTGAKLSIVLG